MTQTATVAFLGLGHMGAPMAANLVAAGFTVHGFDPAPAALAGAVEDGVVGFDSAADAVAGADVVITMLPNGAVVRRCYEQILPAVPEGRCSSTPPRSRSTTPAPCTPWPPSTVSRSWTRRSPAGCPARRPARWRS